jgi:hypothetical protein
MCRKAARNAGSQTGHINGSSGVWCQRWTGRGAGCSTSSSTTPQTSAAPELSGTKQTATGVAGGYGANGPCVGRLTGRGPSDSTDSTVDISVRVTPSRSARQATDADVRLSSLSAPPKCEHPDIATPTSSMARRLRMSGTVSRRAGRPEVPLGAGASPGSTTCLQPAALPHRLRSLALPASRPAPPG